ncbi:MAG: FMN reductase [Propionibacteriaceae bacterium]
MTELFRRPSRIVVIAAGLSQPSSTRLLADRLADAASTALQARGGTVEVEIVELRDWARDLTNNLLTGFPSPGLAGVLARVTEADAVIAVTPIFSASYSGLFKMFFDVLDPDALADKPVLIAATGGSARHSLALEHALRPLFAYLRATVVPTAVYAAPEDWASEGDLRTRIDRAAAQLAQLVTPAGSTTPRAPLDEDDADGEVIPFTRLLAAQRSAAVHQQR